VTTFPKYISEKAFTRAFLSFKFIYLAKHPTLKTDPTIETRRTKEDKIQIVCTIESEEISLNTHHEIQFYQGTGNKLIHTTKLKGSQKEAILENVDSKNDDEKIFFLGNEVIAKNIYKLGQKL